MSERFERLLTAMNIIALVVVLAYAVRDFVLPPMARAYYGSEYKQLVFECDNVMREHFIAKNRARSHPSPDASRVLDAAEVGLLTCHKYDALRKRLIRLGVNENELALLGLEAIEEKADDVRAFVETHEIRY